MPNWQQELVMNEERERGQRGALNQPFGMLVTSINSDTEECKFSYFGARDRLLTITHPFSSSGSWIRAMPEEGTTYVGQFRADEANPQVMSTVSREVIKRNDSFKKNQGLYRPLFPGEIEISSLGAGQLHFSRRPKTELHGGIVNRWADQDKLLSADRSPIHNKQFLQYKSNELGDEEKTGIVGRAKKLDGATAVANTQDPTTASGEFSTWEIAYPKVRDNFAAEHFINMKNPANESPVVLFNYQRGHVLDNAGVQITQEKTQIPLRYRSEYFANDDSSTIHEIDEKGNTYIQLATAAVEGYELDIPAGNYVKTVDLEQNVTIGGSHFLTVNQSSINMVGNEDSGGNYVLSVENDIDIQSRKGNGFMKFSSTEGANQFALQLGNLIFMLDATEGAEQIFILHSTGTQFTIDKSGSLKTATSSGNSIFMDADEDTLTMTSADGSVVSLKDFITIADKSGANLISMNGTDTIQISAKAKVNLNAQSVTIGGGSINFGTLAPLSVAIAEPLALLIDTHIHPTPLGPSGPALPPNTAAILNANPATSFKSEFVKIRTNLA